LFFLGIVRGAQRAPREATPLPPLGPPGPMRRAGAPRRPSRAVLRTRLAPRFARTLRDFAGCTYGFGIPSTFQKKPSKSKDILKWQGSQNQHSSFGRGNDVVGESIDIPHARPHASGCGAQERQGSGDKRDTRKPHDFWACGCAEHCPSRRPTVCTPIRDRR
jgi:hypothetical protein